MEECKGCRNLREPGMGCIFKNRELINLCPCRECLVKVICKEFCYKRNDEIESMHFNIISYL